MSPDVVVSITYDNATSSSAVSEERVTLKGIKSPITLGKIRTAFPFEGTFHFRVKALLKTAGGAGPSAGYVWMDVSKDDEEIQPFTANTTPVVEMKALMLSGPLDPPCSGNTDFEEFTAETAKVIKQRTGNMRNKSGNENDSDDDDTTRKDDSLLHKLGVPRGLQKTATKAVDMGMKSVAVGATSIWNNLKTFGASIQESINIITAPSAMSDQTEEVLASLCDDVSVTFKISNKEHVDLLRKVWKTLFVDCHEPFGLSAPLWREAGFQKDGPAADLKSSGVLALKCLIRMAATYPAQTQEMLAKNKANIKTNYPFAIVAVNVTLLLAELFCLRNNRYLSTSASYWGMFESEASFYDIFSSVFFKLDKMWMENAVQRSGFGELIGQVKGAAQRVLAQGPTSVHEFKAFIEEA